MINVVYIDSEANSCRDFHLNFDNRFLRRIKTASKFTGRIKRNRVKRLDTKL